jgi:hypothetical protein
VEAKPKAGDLRKDTPAISLLLWALWNPVGTDVPLNEYESYVPSIWKLLREGAEATAVAKQLKSIVDSRMGGDSLGTEERAAEALTQWWYWRYVYPEGFEPGSLDDSADE